MKKEEIWFIQPNSILGSSIYFPYAAGVILSYAFSFDRIKEAYSIGGIVFKEDDNDLVLNSMAQPKIVAFSNYFWNFSYNLELAKAVKHRFPEAIIVFGGHQVPENGEWGPKYDFIDIYIYGEGEIPFKMILDVFAGDGNLAEIPNIEYRTGNLSIKTKRKNIGISDYPSPYTTGIFDHLFNVSSELTFNAQLETNRGCPYHCSFCDWCAYELPVRIFPLEKVKSDLKWFSEHKITYCMCVDSNFGMFERDEEIAAYAAELKSETGFPDRFGACFAKNKSDRIFRINKLLNDAGMSKGVSLAFQSMAQDVLNNIGRKNMPKDDLKKQLAMYHSAGIPTYTELILGLPGETYESFCRGIDELLELGQHDSLNVFRCEVYPNSDLANKEYVKKYKIKTAINYLNINHCRITDAVYSGGLEFVASTSTMTEEELARAQLFACVIQAVHCHGLLQYFAIYLHKEKNVKYYDFYNRFISYYLEKDCFTGGVIRKIFKCIINLSNNRADFSYLDTRFGDITWPYEEQLLLDLIFDLDVFFTEIEDFIKTFKIDSCIRNELTRWQQDCILIFNEKDASDSFEYNFIDYFNNLLSGVDVELVKRKTNVFFQGYGLYNTPEEYAREIVWYGRRNKRNMRTPIRL